MGFSLASFGAGFTGQLLKDRNDNKEEERFARRQALINKLNEESADRTESKKVKDGELVQGEDGKWYVEQLDGYGRSTGKRRPASVAEVNAQEKTGYDLESAKGDAAVNTKQAQYYDEDRNLSIQERKQRMALDQQQNARGWAAENRMASQSKEEKDAAKKADKEQMYAQKEAREVLDIITSARSGGEVEDPRIKRLYDKVNLLMGVKPPGWRSQMAMVKAEAERLVKELKGKDKAAPLDTMIVP